TRSKRDWSSDVCSSDLTGSARDHRVSGGTALGTEHRRKAGVWSKLAVLVVSAVAGFTFVSGAFSAKGSDLRPTGGDTASLVKEQIGRASCRERAGGAGG